jgi:hypothetical protein
MAEKTSVSPSPEVLFQELQSAQNLGLKNKFTLLLNRIHREIVTQHQATLKKQKKEPDFDDVRFTFDVDIYQKDPLYATVKYLKANPEIQQALFEKEFHGWEYTIDTYTRDAYVHRALVYTLHFTLPHTTRSKKKVLKIAQQVVHHRGEAQR